jgi:hypothetical protein
MWYVIVWRLMWGALADLSGCRGECDQGRKECTCRKR